MSADNWTFCPICHNLPEEWRNGTEHLYGVVSEQEYNEIKEKCQTLKDQETVREDYECSINVDGTASMWVFAKCENCGVEWSMRQENVKCKMGAAI